MKRILTFLVCALLAGCANVAGEPPAPAQVAARTTLDEQAAIGVENAYQASAELILVAEQSGLLNAESRARLRQMDGQAHAAVLLVRRAYEAGNAPSYAAAIAAAWPLLQQLFVLIPSARSNP
jgi:hypothetical protein